jgi:hypothetical protein
MFDEVLELLFVEMAAMDKVRANGEPCTMNGRSTAA